MKHKKTSRNKSETEKNETQTTIQVLQKWIWIRPQKKQNLKHRKTCDTHQSGKAKRQQNETPPTATATAAATTTNGSPPNSNRQHNTPLHPLPQCFREHLRRRQQRHHDEGANWPPPRTACDALLFCVVVMKKVRGIPVAVIHFWIWIAIGKMVGETVREKRGRDKLGKTRKNRKWKITKKSELFDQNERL